MMYPVPRSRFKVIRALSVAAADSLAFPVMQPLAPKVGHLATGFAEVDFSVGSHSIIHVFGKERETFKDDGESEAGNAPK